VLNHTTLFHRLIKQGFSRVIHIIPNYCLEALFASMTLWFGSLCPSIERRNENTGPLNTTQNGVAVVITTDQCIEVDINETATTQALAGIAQFGTSLKPTTGTGPKVRAIAFSVGLRRGVQLRRQSFEAPPVPYVLLLLSINLSTPKSKMNCGSLGLWTRPASVTVTYAS